MEIVRFLKIKIKFIKNLVGQGLKNWKASKTNKIINYNNKKIMKINNKIMKINKKIMTVNNKIMNIKNKIMNNKKIKYYKIKVNNLIKVSYE